MSINHNHNQKSAVNRLVILSLLIILITGCKGYEDGPAISLNSVETRIRDHWTVEYFSINGEDKTHIMDSALVDSASIYPFPSMDFSYSLTGAKACYVQYNRDTTRISSWVLTHNNKHIWLFRPPSVMPQTVWEIQKLTKNEFHITTSYSDRNDYRLELRKVEE